MKLTYGLQALGAQLDAGAEQRGITSEGIGADYTQFKEQRDFPYKQVQYMQSLLQGLPLETQSYSYYQPSGLEALAGAFSGGQDIYSLLMSLGAKPPQEQPTTTDVVMADGSVAKVG